jgi:serine protease inhibitor
MSKRAWTYCSVAVAIAGLVALSIHRRYWPLPPPSQLEKHLAAAYNETALKLYAELRSEPGNIAISPYSINTAMAMALSGARGDTEAEMRTVLGHTLPREQVDTANAELLSRLGKQRTDLAMANALCLTEYGDTISSAYRDLLV